jgi:hypothetical protein
MPVHSQQRSRFSTTDEEDCSMVPISITSGLVQYYVVQGRFQASRRQPDGLLLVAWAAPSGYTLYRGCTVDMHCMLFTGDIHGLAQSVQDIVKLQQHDGSHLFRKPGLPFAWYWWYWCRCSGGSFLSFLFSLAMVGRSQVIGTIVTPDRTIEYLPRSGFCPLEVLVFL